MTAMMMICSLVQVYVGVSGVVVGVSVGVGWFRY